MGCLEVEFLGQWTDMDIIFQAKALETTQPGDRCELVRTLIVVLMWEPSIFLDPRPSPATSVETKIENRPKTNTRNVWVQNTDQRSMMMADRWESVHKMSQEKNMYNNIINSLFSHHSIQQSMRSR